MKGMIFTEFLDMVEEEYGLEIADRIISRVAPENAGGYTSVGNYDHEEMVQLVVALSEATDTPVTDLLDSFGQWVFLRLFVAHYKDFFAEPKDAFEFLAGIESYIHTEVRKLYPDAELPAFETRKLGDAQLEMLYRSQRPMAHFAYGLIKGCIQYYGEAVDISMEDLSDGAGTAARFTLTGAQAAA